MGQQLTLKLTKVPTMLSLDSDQELPMPTWLIFQLFAMACMPAAYAWRATVADLQRPGFRRP
jgi:hypothetical protein